MQNTLFCQTSHPTIARVGTRLPLFLLAGLVASLLTMVGCQVEFDPTAPDTFACSEDSDCLPPNVCVKSEGEMLGICGRLGGPEPAAVNCADMDGDGYGVGPDCLGPDCDDDDDTVFPGALEICDGKDNDCDCVDGTMTCPMETLTQMVDEPTGCMVDADCEEISMATPRTVNQNGMRCLVAPGAMMGECVFRCPLDNIGVCATAAPDGGGGIERCMVTPTPNAATGGFTFSVPSCPLSGAYGPNYSTDPESMEACDGLDNNCNTKVDDSQRCMQCGQPCSTNFGECTEGIIACDENNNIIGCVDAVNMQPVVMPEAQDVCDGKDNDCNGIVDNSAATPTSASSSCPNGCPFGMALIRDGNTVYCIDRFEASRPDATPASPGIDPSRAVSRPGVVPWTNLTPEDARDACRGSGGQMFANKRLCSQREMEFVCGGVNMSPYSYGANYNGMLCNGLDAGIAGAVPTGPTDDPADTDFSSCSAMRGDAVVYDLNGNVAEYVLDNVQAVMIYGGSFESPAAAMTCQSAVPGQQVSPAVGFRCCFDP